jgi:hypothetical protein
MDMLAELVGAWEFSRPTASGRVHSEASARIEDEVLHIDVPRYDRERALHILLETLHRGRFSLVGPADRIEGELTSELVGGVLELEPDAFPAAMVWTLRRPGA